ncbi:MAG: TonB-dependent receptor domain-containing protein, partial [Vicinamibacteria bacterium]
SHEFKFGLQLSRGKDRWIYGYPGGAWYSDYAGAPYRAYFGGPDTAGGVVRRVAAFAEDVAELGSRLTVHFGLRFDRNTSESPDIPAVDSIGEETGTTIQGLGTVFSWNSISPRLGFTLALDRDSRTLLRGSWGRYYQGGFAAEFETFHPGKRLSTTALFDPTTGAYSRILDVFDPLTGQGFDPQIRAPYTDQLSFGLDRALFRDASVGLGYVRKRGRLFTGWEDTGGIYGTDTATLRDGRTMTVFPLLNSPSDRFYLLTNPESYYLDYDGLILTFEKRWAKRWQILGSYTLSESTGLQSSSFRAPGGNQDSSGGWFNRGRDPNEVINAEGNLPADRTHMFRVQAGFDVPKVGVIVAGSFQHLTGAPWAAASIVSLPQGPRSILIEPRGSRRLPSQNLLDLRISKAFTFGAGKRVEVLLDLLNALNDDANQWVATSNFFSPSFGEGRNFLSSRRVMLGVRASF